LVVPAGTDVIELPAGNCWGSAVMVAGPVLTSLANALPFCVEVMATSSLGRPPLGSSVSTRRSTKATAIRANTANRVRAIGSCGRGPRALRLRPVSGVVRSLAIVDQFRTMQRRWGEAANQRPRPTWI
jgi:hypothetical protein